jgi:cell division protein ZipA
MDLPWILLFISIILVALIAWHSSKLSLLQILKSRFTRKPPEAYFTDYHEEVQDDLFAELEQDLDPLDELPNPPRTQNAVFCINLKAPEGRHFGGEQLVVQLNRAGLRFGDFNIFHFENLFSCASAFEPGTFDLDRIDSFKTRGLTFFMETGHVNDIRDAFETMLEATQHLAEQLRGQLCDDQWQPLNEDSLERYYDRIQAL